jgi:hypothetical protein
LCTSAIPKSLHHPKTNITILLLHPKPVVKCDGGDVQDEKFGISKHTGSVKYIPVLKD